MIGSDWNAAYFDDVQHRIQMDGKESEVLEALAAKLEYVGVGESGTCVCRLPANG